MLKWRCCLSDGLASALGDDFLFDGDHLDEEVKEWASLRLPTDGFVEAEVSERVSKAKRTYAEVIRRVEETTQEIMKFQVEVKEREGAERWIEILTEAKSEAELDDGKNMERKLRGLLLAQATADAELEEAEEPAREAQREETKVKWTVTEAQKALEACEGTEVRRIEFLLQTLAKKLSTTREEGVQGIRDGQIEWKQVKELCGQTKAVCSLCRLKDGRLVVSSRGRDNNLKVFDLESGEREVSLEGKRGSVLSGGAAS